MNRRTSVVRQINQPRRIINWENQGSLPPPNFLRPIPLRKQKKLSYKKMIFSAFISLFLLTATILLISIVVKSLINVFSGKTISLDQPVYFSALQSPELPQTEDAKYAHVIKKVKARESLDSLLSKMNLDSETAERVIESFENFKKEKKIKTLLKPNQPINFVFDLNAKLQRVATEPEAGKKLIFERTKNDDFSTRIKTKKAEKREQVFIGTIESSFAAAANKAGINYDLVDDLVDLFSDRVEFNKDFQKGDRFTLIYRDKLLSDGRPSGVGTILAAALEIEGKHLIAARFIGSDGKARYFNEKGELLGNSFLRYPLKFSRISSFFSQSRFHPVLKFSRPHNGIDFAAPTGTAVRTIGDGEVIFAGKNGGSGIMLRIKHSPRFTTEYLHLSSIANNLKKGARVSRGEVIGAVGMTGLATGPHLHFGFFDNGKYVDPLKAKLPMVDSLIAGTNINPNYLKRVLFTLKHYQTVNLDPYYQVE